MDIYYILKDLFRTKNLQEWINHRFKDDSKVILSKDIFDRVITKTNETYFISDFINSVEQVKRDYIFDDIRKDDIDKWQDQTSGAIGIIHARNKNKKIRTNRK